MARSLLPEEHEQMRKFLGLPRSVAIGHTDPRQVVSWLRTQNSQGGPIVIPEGTWQIDDDITFTVPVMTLGTLNVASGKTITIGSGGSLDMTSGGLISGTGSLTFAAGSSAELPESRQVFGAGLTVTMLKQSDFYPEWWGAVGDGKPGLGTGTVDTTAIQAAIDCANTAQGGVIHFKNKIYRTGRITLYRNIVLRGPNLRFRDDTYIYLATLYTPTWTPGDGIGLVYFPGTDPYDDVGIENIALALDGTATDPGFDFRLSELQGNQGRVWMRNCYVFGFSPSYKFVNLSATQVENCRAHASDGVGFLLDASASTVTAANNYFRNCVAGATQSHGWHLKGPLRVTMEECYSEAAGSSGTGNGLYIEGSSGHTVICDLNTFTSELSGTTGSPQAEIVAKVLANSVWNAVEVFGKTGTGAVPQQTHLISLEDCQGNTFNSMNALTATLYNSGYAGIHMTENTGTMKGNTFNSCRASSWLFGNTGAKDTVFNNCYWENERQLLLNNQSGTDHTAEIATVNDHLDALRFYASAKGDNIRAVTLRLKTDVTGTDKTLQLRFYSHAAGLPSAVVGTSATYDASNLTTDYQDVRFYYSTTAGLTAQASGWMVLLSTAGTGNVFIQGTVGGRGGLNPHTVSTDGGSSWAAVDGDDWYHIIDRFVVDGHLLVGIGNVIENWVEDQVAPTNYATLAPASTSSIEFIFSQIDPALLDQSSGGLLIEAWGSITGANAAKDIYLYVGSPASRGGGYGGYTFGTLVNVLSASNVNGLWYLRATLSQRAYNVQTLDGAFFLEGANPDLFTVDLVLNSRLQLQVGLNVDRDNVGDDIELRHWKVTRQ